MARQVGSIVKGLSPDGSPESARPVVRALEAYADLLEPWARSVGNYMVHDVSRRDLKAWRAHSKDIGEALRDELKTPPSKVFLQEMLREQVELITSLPKRAAQRVHRLTTEALVTGERAASVAEKILETGKVTESQAMLIARTEVARTSFELIKARAVAVGSEGYIWRTAEDFDVRKSHAEMEGRYVRWNTAPRLSDGTVAHAGCTYNCRCYPEPVIPDDL